MKIGKILLILCVILALWFTFFGDFLLRPEGLLSKADLAFPGTAWNMTPEEVRQALEIPTEQWRESGAGDYLVEHLELWERPVTVCFQFRDLAKAGYRGLFRTVVLFEEDTAEALLAEIKTRMAEDGRKNPSYESFPGYENQDIQYLETRTWVSSGYNGALMREMMELQGQSKERIEDNLRMHRGGHAGQLQYVELLSAQENLTEIPCLQNRDQTCPAVVLIGGETWYAQRIDTLKSE